MKATDLNPKQSRRDPVTEYESQPGDEDDFDFEDDRNLFYDEDDSDIDEECRRLIVSFARSFSDLCTHSSMRTIWISKVVSPPN